MDMEWSNEFLLAVAWGGCLVVLATCLWQTFQLSYLVKLLDRLVGQELSLRDNRDLAPNKGAGTPDNVTGKP